MWMPGRPDIQKVIEDQGKQDNRKGATNAWPVDMLQPRDVYVADHFGLKVDGPSIGDNVGNAIYARSGNGIVYDGAVRDINGLEELPNFTSFVRSYDPSHHYGTLSSGPQAEFTMVSINGPTRIGQALVMPGDVVLGRNGGVLFIPPQLAEKVVKYSERTHLQDMFGHQRLKEKKYTAGQIDAEVDAGDRAGFSSVAEGERRAFARPEVYCGRDSERASAGRLGQRYGRIMEKSPAIRSNDLGRAWNLVLHACVQNYLDVLLLPVFGERFSHLGDGLRIDDKVSGSTRRRISDSSDHDHHFSVPCIQKSCRNRVGL